MRTSGRPIRIAYVIDSLRDDGAQRELTYLVRGLAKRDYEQRVYCLNDRSDPQVIRRLEDSGAAVTVVGRFRVLTLVGILGLYSAFRRWQPDIVQTTLWVSDAIGRTVARAAGVRIVISWIQARNVDKSPWQFLIDRATVRWADRVTFNSARVVPFAQAHEGVRDEQVVYVPNGVPEPAPADERTVAEIRRQWGTAEGAKVIGMVARLYPQKDHACLLRAFAAVQGRMPGTRLVLAGDGPLREGLESMARDLGVGEHVHFLGHRHDVWTLLAAMDLYVHPSLFEGMPNAVMEAMAAGKPVIASDIDGNRELITDGITGWLVRPGDPGALADRILRALGDMDASREAGRTAAKRIRADLSLDRMIMGYDGLYRSLLAEKGHIGSAPCSNSYFGGVAGS